MSSAKRAATQGCSVILDAAFLRDGERTQFAATAPLSIPHAGLFLTAGRAVRLARIAQRSGDASDATATIAVQQEDIAPGSLDWPQVDAEGSPEQTLAAAVSALRLQGVTLTDVCGEA